MFMEVFMNVMQRFVRLGMGWIEDLFFMGGFSNFVQNIMFYLGGQGEVE